MAFITILKDKRANYNPPKVTVMLDRIATYEKIRLIAIYVRCSHDRLMHIYGIHSKND